MTKLLFFSICLFVLSFTSCQKDPLPDTPAISNSCDGYCAYTVGSYWTYQHVLVDSNDIENILGVADTIHVTGDTLINGHTYSILERNISPSNFSPIGILDGSISYVRDSLHYLVNHYGTILFSSQDFNSILSQISTTSMGNGSTVTNDYSFKMEQVVDPISLPAGTFNVLNYERTAVSTDPYTNAIFAYKNSNQYYAQGVGKVLETYVLSDKRVLEQRLLSYHIQ